jgi:hypothetical protein
MTSSADGRCAKTGESIALGGVIVRRVWGANFAGAVVTPDGINWRNHAKRAAYFSWWNSSS